MRDYDIYHEDELQPLIFEFCEEIYALVITHSEIVMNKLFKNDYPIILSKIQLKDRETISHVSDPEFWGDRVFFCYLTNLGNITINYVVLPTEIDPQIHIESVQLNEFKKSLISSLKIPNFIEMTKSLLFQSTEDQNKDFRAPNQFSKIKIKHLERKCEDKFFFTFAAVHGDKFIHGAFYLQDKWHNEKSRYVKLEESSYWEIDLIDVIQKFDIGHLASNDFGKKDTPQIELFDFIPYQV